MFKETLSKWVGMPESASTFSGYVDGVYAFILVLCLVCFAGIVITMVGFMVKYYRGDGRQPEPSPSHNTTLEVTWSVIPSFLVLILFALGFAGYEDMRTTPPNSYEILVSAKMWNWDFTYKDGQKSGITNELHIPVGEPVRLVMSSQDVIHSLYVPAFRAKQDVVPGRFTEMWFQSDKPGTYNLFCAEYCGTKHSDMITKVVVEERETFDPWVSDVCDIIKACGGDLLCAGEKLYQQRGCAQCHSLDGKKLTGPTFQGSFGTERKLVGGRSQLMDGNYIIDSIENPMKDIVEGYEPKMPSFAGQFTMEEKTALVEFIKSYGSAGSTTDSQ